MGDVRLGEQWTTAQRWRNQAIYASALAALHAARHVVPLASLDTVGAALGSAACAAMPASRRRAEARLRAAFGGTPPVTAQLVFRSLGRDLADAVRLLDERERADATLGFGDEAADVVRRALAGRRGVVFATAHLGPIERMAAVVASRGYPVVTLARESYDPRFTQLYERLRAPRGVRTIYRGSKGADVKVVRALREGCLVGFPMDLAGRGMATMRCEFLGESAEIPIGPARIAVRTGAAVLVGTPARAAAGGLEVTVENVEAGTDPQELALRVVRAIERRVMALPEHWPWMHGVRKKG